MTAFYFWALRQAVQADNPTVYDAQTRAIDVPSILYETANWDIYVIAIVPPRNQDGIGNNQPLHTNQMQATWFSM